MIPVDLDFQNSHNIVGFCGIDTHINPVWYRIEQNLEGMQNSDFLF
jgi:hypothetical protein